MDKQATLDWLAAICDDALKEARSGNALPANKIGSNAALAHYLNNVAGLKTIKPNDWALWYPQYMEEADALRVASEQRDIAEEQGDRISVLEGKFDELMAALKPLLEPEKPKRKSRKAKPVEESQEAETVEETDPVLDDETQDKEAVTETEDAVDDAAESDVDNVEDADDSEA